VAPQRTGDVATKPVTAPEATHPAGQPAVAPVAAWQSIGKAKLAQLGLSIAAAGPVAVPSGWTSQRNPK
jgi:hypothetical protein